MKERRELAAGGVVGRGDRVLLVRVRNLEGELRWTFPKGHLEKGETWRAAALREVEEETGWRCRIRGALSSVSYRFRRGARPVFKRVRWYRMEPIEKTGRPDAEEILKTRWMTPAAAAARLSYPSDARVLARYRTTPNGPVPGLGWRKTKKRGTLSRRRRPGGDG
ncbi:MAG: NUDIX domain-containing protein [Elusimicrobia bacterium]|nr:NUDIX domain-containing protein [Elusimicrobiota bacterium]